MSNKIYNQKKVAANTVSIGASSQRAFTYKGFNSRKIKQGFKQYDIDLVKQDIINNFQIKKGQKLENPEYGTILWDMLFEPMNETNKQLIAKDVENIVNSDPRVTVTEVSIDATEHGIRIEVGLVYLPFDVSEKLSLSFDNRNIPV